MRATSRVTAYAERMNPADAALIVGATARLTRLVVADDLGQWWAKDPIEQLAARHVEAHGQVPGWWRYADGLNCPHCLSFHAAYIVRGSHAIARRNRRALAVWRFGAAALSLSYVVGHTGARLGDTASE